LLTLQTGAYVPPHSRQEAEVLFVQEGVLEVRWSDGAILMGPGDTLTVPVGLQRSFRNTASTPSKVFVVRGGDDPASPSFASGRAAA
jgi:mannose-6-phosphate isomerase-like protein (cupin superfamily)